MPIILKMNKTDLDFFLFKVYIQVEVIKTAAVKDNYLTYVLFYSDRG